MRKINAILISALIFLLIVHSGIAVLSMLKIIHCKGIIYTLGSIAALLLIFHIIISLILMINNMRKKPSIKFYSNINKDTVLQNLTGILIIILIPVHIFFSELQQFSITPPLNLLTAIHGTIEIIFITLICIHLCIGIPKLLITYGNLADLKSYSLCKKFVSIISIVIWLIFIFGIIMYFFIPLL
ncbi:hypothetical protein [Clostridium felsineum]|uniref:Uncharacterized protein n=1 Tax=Clostridium felsineum TaxID=36839 RepID=A0A1S8LIB6_9CLOT|nr:hypothetical protein [Clostridium felsineum]MCR3759440.1 hypothetical protein [Clostridium felsineum]URZ01646.1 hypothetical protein CLAUR_016410 [Clostridium felsineum]URZ05505.1 hypothetical protein CLROS_008310 [Clostridium felsineum]URZ10544.1 hypothetical protein CROST_012540 [Clostridium felsineum]URZ17539.1 hypothetical protein CLFE_035920 [Clostridium felsineum DSM 794]